MPEGDTVHKLANYLAPRLAGRVVDRLELARGHAAKRVEGRGIREVSAEGKHLYIEFDNGLVLRSHLGMYGAWHRYAAGESWQKPAARASIVLESAGEIYVCFNAKEVELLPAGSVRRRIAGQRLGPDLAGPDAAPAAAVRRARQFLDGDALIADVLLDQRIAAGIGNVYKSEILFLNRRLPTTPLRRIGDEELARHYALAAGLLARNLGGGPRVTRFEPDDAGRLWVYGRSARPCLRCGGQVDSARLGRRHRSTYWCGNCQS